MAETDKIKQSNFFLTLNTNLSPHSPLQEKEIVKRLGDGIKRMLTDHDDMRRMVKFLVPGHTYSSRYIVSSDGEFAVEKGGRMKRLHVHVWIQIAHKSKIHLDLGAVREIAKLRTGFDVPYMNVKIIRKDPFANVRDYLRKANLYNPEG